MRESAMRMLQAMRRGYSITPMNGPYLIGSTAVSQRYQELRDHVGVTEIITSERVPGHRYHRYFIKGALNHAAKDRTIVVSPHVRKAPVVLDDQPGLFS